jgi:hypothetical protein
MKRLVTVLATRQTFTLSTSYEYPPIPIRSFDWVAINDDTYDYDSPAGRGPTEVGAIHDLFDQLAAGL